jgi:NTP pyrophosphatase (non-canonical NTP hydrolase)
MSNEPQVNYQEFVRGLIKPGEVVAASLSAQDADAIHMIMGVCGEAGELLDSIKKAAIYRKPYDIENIVEELGDIEFYLCGLRNTFGLDRQVILARNVAKLQKRYPKGYSNEAAQARADKQ